MVQLEFIFKSEWVQAQWLLNNNFNGGFYNFVIWRWNKIAFLKIVKYHKHGSHTIFAKVITRNKVMYLSNYQHLKNRYWLCEIGYAQFVRRCMLAHYLGFHIGYFSVEMFNLFLSWNYSNVFIWSDTLRLNKLFCNAQHYRQLPHTSTVVTLCQLLLLWCHRRLGWWTLPFFANTEIRIENKIKWLINNDQICDFYLYLKHCLPTVYKTSIPCKVFPIGILRMGQDTRQGTFNWGKLVLLLFQNWKFEC